MTWVTLFSIMAQTLMYIRRRDKEKLLWAFARLFLCILFGLCCKILTPVYFVCRRKQAFPDAGDFGEVLLTCKKGRSCNRHLGEAESTL